MLQYFQSRLLIPSWQEERARLIWMILHQAIRYEERGPAVSRATTQRRATKMIRELRHLGYRVELITAQRETV